MSIADIHTFLLYALVLVAYLPGLVAILRMQRLAMLPVVTFTFLGMFLFTAAGSILIMTRPHFALGTLLSGEYVAMLIMQALIFYAVAGPYLFLRRLPLERPTATLRTDRFVRGFLLLMTALILALYYIKVGRFLLFDLLAGRINRVNILEYRAQTYGLPEYPFFRLGFFVFPALVAALTVAMASARKRFAAWDAFVIGICLVPPLLLAEKAAILHMAAVLFIAYALHLGSSGRSLVSALRGKAVLVVGAAFLPTLATYLVYFSAAGDSVQAAGDQLLFRIVGVYSEALAATVPFVERHGFLGGITMPNLKGILPHERFNLETAMHSFLAAGTEYRVQVALHGASPVPATGEGYVNFGWPGFALFSVVSFACVVLFQEILLRLRLCVGPTAIALSAWYGYLGFTLFTTTVFATFISLTHTIVAVGVLLIWYAAHTWFDHRSGKG